MADILTATETAPVPLLDGQCHAGILASAQWLIRELQPMMQE